MEKPIKKLRKKKCKVCKVQFQPIQPFQAWCSPNCGYQWQRILRDKRERKELKDRKQALLSRPDYLLLAQKVFNTYIRERDKLLPCISCGTSANVKYDAGHFWAAGNYSFLRFNENNVHKQCSNKCNKHLSGNLIEYRFNLIRRIGEDEVLKLDEVRHELLRLSIPEIKELIIEYRDKLKELKKENII